jgi:hypothetical protein
MSHITNVIPLDNYCLEVVMGNGSKVILDMKNKLETVRFGILSDIALFQRATSDGTYIRWDNAVEISVNELFQLALK